MKTILFTIPDLYGGGSQRIISYLVNNLDKNKFKIKLLLIQQANHHYLKDIKKEIEIIQLNLKTKLRRSIFITLKTINKLNPDIVFIGSGDLAALLSPFIVFFRKFIWITRETNFVSYRNKSLVFKILYLYFYKNFDSIIAQCNDMKDDLVKNFKLNVNKIKVINNPIDNSFIDKFLIEDNQVKLAKNKINLLACGRLNQQKGFDLLLKNFASLKNKSYYHLTIIGEANLQDHKDNSLEIMELHQKFNLKNQVTFIGYKNNIYQWLKKADIFILSSRYEGLPNVLLEALYCGTPSLANNCPGGIKEIINQSNGLIFDFNKGDFGEKLDQIVKKLDKYNAEKISKGILKNMLKV